jgi:hypothetical protein
MVSGTASAVRRTAFLLLVTLAATASGLALTAPPAETCPVRGSCNLETGLLGRTDLLLFEDWELPGWLTHWTGSDLLSNLDVVTTPPPFAGLQGLEIRVPAGQHDGASLLYDFTAAGLAEPEEAYLRYYIRFNDSWQEANHYDNMGKLPGFEGTYNRCGWGGRKADGTCWSARMFSGSTATTNNVGFYVYHTDMPTNFGDNWHWLQPGTSNHFEFQRNRWYCLEQRVKLNTPGANDGILQGWVDDVLVFTRTNIRFRDLATTRIEAMWWNIYQGGTWTADRDMALHFDNAVIARNRVGCVGSSPPPPPPPGCQLSSPAWQNTAFAAQSGLFTAQFEVTPAAAGIDGITGLAATSAAAYADLAAIVRFNPAGLIDARNGDAYAALTPLPYVAGSTYRVRMVVNVPTHTYSVYVTPPGLSEQVVGLDYAFRTEQSAVTALTTLALSSNPGTHTVCNVWVANRALQVLLSPQDASLGFNARS